MKRLTLLILTTLSIQSVGFSQELFREGYILKSPFDTVRGEIKYMSYNQAAVQCIFRPEGSTEEKVYWPNEIFGYGLGKDMLFNTKRVSDNEKVFLEVVYQGTVVLYAYRDRYRRDYFYLENSDTGNFEKLTQKVIGGKRRRSVIKTYLDVIKLMLPKSELIADKIEGTSLTHKSLTRLLSEYDERYAQFKGRIFNGSSKQWPPKIGFYTMQGFAQQKLTDFAGTGDSYFKGVAVKFEKEISRATRRLYLDLDISLSHEEFSQQYTRTEEVTDQSIITNGLNYVIAAVGTNIRGDVDHLTTVDLERWNIGMPINLKYVFPGKKWLFTINGGLNPQLTVAKNGRVTGILSQGEDILLSITSREETNSFRYGVNFGFGLILKSRNNIHLDFQHSPTWFNQGVLKYKYSFLRIGIVLGKGD